ncbi:MAG: class II aldolase/adducin family protein [Thermoanaerobacter sp.]|nr:class II aldolase/adducin family protein [Thermoanaerobacter sp.]
MKEYSNTRYMNDHEAQEAIIEIGKRMYLKGYVASNDGNISIKVSPNEIWVTPTGVSKGYMTHEMLVKLDLDGNIISGNNKPSSEIKMHLKVYKENPDAKAVTHAHPPIATAFAVAGIPLDKPILPEAIINLGAVPVARYATPGTEEVPESIAPYCNSYNGVLLANHGALTWGKDIFEAYYRLESLEHYATIMLYAYYIIGKVNELNSKQISKLVEIKESYGIDIKDEFLIAKTNIRK